MADIFTLADDVVDTIAAHVPLEATYVGVEGHDHRWGDLSTTGVEALRDELIAYRRRIGELPPSGDHWADLAVRVAAAHLDLHLDDMAHDEHLLDLDSLASTLQGVREVFDVMDKASAAGWDNITCRLATLDQALAGYRSRLEDGRRQGRTVARRQVLEGARQARVVAGEESPFRRLPGELAAAGVATPGLADRLDAAVPAACAAFGDLADYLEQTYLPDAVPHDPVGAERYVRLARRFLGSELDPAETYRWGWEEVGRLRAAMERVADEISPGAGRAGAIEVLKTDPARSAPDHDAFVALMLERQLQALADLDGTHFDVPTEIRRIDVKIAPPGGSLGAWYVSPTEDYSRPGTVWYALPAEARVPLYDHISTAYHEGFPGHHLQSGTQVTLKDNLSRLHRLMIWYSGYGEGWALYTELLMHELGYLEKPDYVMGMLAGQMLRACRVVIDIGTHLELPIPDGQPFHPGEAWTYETAVEMLVDDATLGDDYARSEVNRYLGWPGQAISYKVGERAILDLRAELEKRDGAAFDLKDFHSRVIGSGPLGLDLLREVVLAG